VHSDSQQYGITIKIHANIKSGAIVEVHVAAPLNSY